jgi:endonuclease/exonuclease/phosphatase family metal-dependent hydrolase
LSTTVTVTDHRMPDESQVRAASDHFPVVADVAVT